MSADGGAGGPAAAGRGPSQRPGAVGEREQNQRGPARGHGHLDGPARPGPGVTARPQNSSWLVHVQTPGALIPSDWNHEDQKSPETRKRVKVPACSPVITNMSLLNAVYRPLLFTVVNYFKKKNQFGVF